MEHWKSYEIGVCLKNDERELNLRSSFMFLTKIHHAVDDFKSTQRIFRYCKNFNFYVKQDF